MLSPVARGAVTTLFVLVAVVCGCGGRSFRVVERRAARVSLEGAREVWVATDVTDPLAVRLARRVVDSLAMRVDARVVALGRPPESGVVIVSVAPRRSVTHEPRSAMRSEWTCDPSGPCYARQVPSVLDVPVMRLIVRVSVHDALGRVLEPPRVLDAEQSGEDEIVAELRLVSRAHQEIVSLFVSVEHERALEVEALALEAAQRALEAALAAPDAGRCEAIEAFAHGSEPSERARVLHASGQCLVAVALADPASVDVTLLSRAEQLLLAAVRLRPIERYARAVAEVRAIMPRVAPTRPADVSLPEPPPTYR